MPDAIQRTHHTKGLNGTWVDAVHINKMGWLFAPAEDGVQEKSYVVSFRHYNQVQRICATSGNVMWKIGGDDSDFTFVDSTREFSYQHDARIEILVDKRMILSLYDNGNKLKPLYSRAVIFQIDETEKTLTQLWERSEPLNRFGFATGSTQRLSNGNVVISWGGVGLPAGLPFYTEVTANAVDEADDVVSEEILLDLTFELAESSYHAYKSDWKGKPCHIRSPPTMLISYSTEIPELRYSWNGATEVGMWKIYGGETREPITLFRTHFKSKFEHSIKLTDMPKQRCYYFQAHALDIHGALLGKSNLVFSGYWGPGEC
eukprot:TRINITY_DN28799_c0_g1_i2.p2 TRINITY_DN28799_c0_g1~~TRINITY_DN28799_c0_g1_i2.p2  ORF type:complete len:317 (+),score=28.69 TRINITY_DN28799_c0_g1_i2:85-1035(+)